MKACDAEMKEAAIGFLKSRWCVVAAIAVDDAVCVVSNGLYGRAIGSEKMEWGGVPSVGTGSSVFEGRCLLLKELREVIKDVVVGEG